MQINLHVLCRTHRAAHGDVAAQIYEYSINLNDGFDGRLFIRAIYLALEKWKCGVSGICRPKEQSDDHRYAEIDSAYQLCIACVLQTSGQVPLLSVQRVGKDRKRSRHLSLHYVRFNHRYAYDTSGLSLYACVNDSHRCVKKDILPKRISIP